MSTSALTFPKFGSAPVLGSPGQGWGEAHSRDHAAELRGNSATSGWKTSTSPPGKTMHALDNNRFPEQKSLVPGNLISSGCKEIAGEFKFVGDQGKVLTRCRTSLMAKGHDLFALQNQKGIHTVIYQTDDQHKSLAKLLFF